MHATESRANLVGPAERWLVRHQPGVNGINVAMCGDGREMVGGNYAY